MDELNGFEVQAFGLEEAFVVSDSQASLEDISRYL